MAQEKASTIRSHVELVAFNLASKKKIDPEELIELSNKVLRQSSEFAQDVAEVVFEEKCTEQFKLMCQELKEAGYHALWVSNISSSHSANAEFRAYPRIEGIWGQNSPLSRICGKYFYVGSSRGGPADADMQSLSIRFPACLLGIHDLRASDLVIPLSGLFSRTI